MGRIVVGVDGSDHSRRALRWAVEEAHLREADLEVVHAIPEPHLFVDPIAMPAPPTEQLRESGMTVLDRALREVDTSGLNVERIVAIGGSGQVLCETAEGAELLVVGSRGLGGFRGLLVGSVTQQAVAHSPCPVLIVVPEGRSH